MVSLSRRSEALELMDDPELAGEELRTALDGIARLNRSLGGYSPSLDGIRRLLPRETREFSVLDVGTGGGDFPRYLETWARRRRLRVQVKGIDSCRATVEYARHLSRTVESLEFEHRDLFSLPSGETFDIVHGSLLLHHLDEQRAGEALRLLFDRSRWGVVINDLHRHPVAYHGIRLLTRLCFRSPMMRHDGPLSVARAFLRRELRELALRHSLPEPEIRWRWAFRWQVVLRK